MTSSALAQLLKLPAGERAERAIALWESLTDTERASELDLPPDQLAELDRRWAEHVADPSSGIPWDEVHRRLRGGK